MTSETKSSINPSINGSIFKKLAANSNNDSCCLESGNISTKRKLIFYINALLFIQIVVQIMLSVYLHSIQRLCAHINVICAITV